MSGQNGQRRRGNGYLIRKRISNFHSDQQVAPCVFDVIVDGSRVALAVNIDDSMEGCCVSGGGREGHCKSIR